MKPWISVVATLLALTACQPADVKVKTVKERLEAGQLVEFTEPGYRRPSCSDRAPDWSALEVSNQEERERVILKSQASILHPGRHSCYRVGSVVNLKVFREDETDGQVQITKLSLIKLDKLHAGHLKGRFFSKSEDFESYKNFLAEKRMRPEFDNIVTIVEFVYITDSASDQVKIWEDEEKRNSGDGYQETTKDGEKVGTCPGSTWRDIRIPPEFHADVLAGNIKSWYTLGDRSCFEQGQEVEITPIGGGASVGRVRISKLKIFKLEALNAERFNLPNYSYEEVKKAIEQHVAKMDRPQKWIVVIDFELVSTDGGR